MDLVDEEYGAFAVPFVCLRLLDRFTQIFHAGEDSRECDETHATAARQQLCEGGLAGARCAPENQRWQCAAAGEQPSQNAAFADEMCLADELRKRAWPHAFGQGSALRRRACRGGLRCVVAKQAS